MKPVIRYQSQLLYRKSYKPIRSFASGPTRERSRFVLRVRVPALEFESRN